MVLSPASGSHVARLDPGHAFAPLFRPLAHGVRPRVEAAQTIGTAQLTWRAFWALDAADQTVLLALVWILGCQQLRLADGHPNPEGQALWKALDPTGQAGAETAAAGRTSLRAIMLAAGWEPSGRRRALVRESLKRLAHVTVSGRDGSKTWSCNLLGLKVDEATGQLHVALNPALAAALLGGGGQHVRYALAERTQLESDAARIAHVWLSAWLRPGGQGVIGLDRLAEHVWGGEAPSEAARRWRRSTLTAALEELAAVGWQVKVGAGKATIRRPADPDAPERKAPPALHRGSTARAAV